MINDYSFYWVEQSWGLGDFRGMFQTRPSPVNGRESARHQADQILRLEDLNNVLGVFWAVYECARDAAHPAARQNWRAASGQILFASRRAEELLQPFLRVEVFPEELRPDAAESVAFTHPTAQSHPQAPVERSVTAVTWSVTEETQTQGKR